MQAPRWYARFNRRFTNRVVRLWAGWSPAMLVLEHVGRRSGKAYRTPLNMLPIEGGVAILVGYGPDTDWLQNVVVAGGARVRHYGKIFEVGNPRFMSKPEAVPQVQGHWQKIFSIWPFDNALLLTRVG